MYVRSVHPLGSSQRACQKKFALRGMKIPLLDLHPYCPNPIQILKIMSLLKANMGLNESRELLGKTLGVRKSFISSCVGKLKTLAQGVSLHPSEVKLYESQLFSTLFWTSLPIFGNASPSCRIHMF